MAEGKIKIVFIISLLDRMGGAEKNLYDVTTNLEKDNFSVSVIAFKAGEVAAKLTKIGIPVHVVPILKIFSLKTIKLLWALYTDLKKAKPDLVVTYHHDADIAGGVAAWLARVPRIISSRRDMGYQLQTKHIWFYRLSGVIFHKFITVSRAVAEEIAKREWISAKKIAVIHNGLNMDEFLPDKSTRVELRASFAVTPEQLLVGCVASFRPIKGQMFLVQAVAKLLPTYPQLKVLFVGYNDNDYGHEVKAEAAALGIAPRCIFAGMRGDVPSLLNAFDIFVVPSIHEGFSNAIIEAMASELPVIAARSGGNPEAVVDGKTGLLFEAENSHDLVRKLEILCQDSSRRLDMGKSGKTQVQERFQLEGMVSRYKEEFCSLGPKK